MITTTLLTILAAGEPAIETSGSSPTLREGHVGSITWGAPVECGELEEAAGDALPDLLACEHEYHVWVEHTEAGWVGHRRWNGSDGQEESRENEADATCQLAMRYLAEQAANHCTMTDVPPPSPPPPPPGPAGLKPEEDEQEQPIQPLPRLRSAPPVLIDLDLLLLAGFGADDQTLGRGGSLGLGFDGGRWRVLGLVAYEQLFRLGEERTIIEEIEKRSTRFIRGEARVCYDFLHGAGNPGGWEVAAPLCGGFGIGQIRNPGDFHRSTEKTTWTGVDGSLSFVMGRGGPFAFRAGLDYVVSLPGGRPIGVDARFYEPGDAGKIGDVGARLLVGLELRPGRLSRTSREERKQARRDRKSGVPGTRPR